MRVSLSLLTILSACATAVPAPAPAEAQQSKRSFKVERIRNPHFVQRNILSGMPRAHRRFDFEEANVKAKNNNGSPARNSTVQNGEEGNVTATPVSGDVEFISQITIGGQSLNMVFDTGSADFWVLNTQLENSQSLSQTLFDPTNSPTFKLSEGSSYNISYGDGSFSSGLVGTDSVNIGGATVDDLSVGLATDISVSFTRFDSSGLLGLGFSVSNTVKPVRQKTFFEKILPELKEPVFTANLRAGTPGVYEFGDIDSTQFEGNLSWAPINPRNGFWQFTSSSAKIDGAEVNTPKGQAIADTGTTFLILDPRVAAAYFEKANVLGEDRQGTMIVSCDEDLPNLSLDIGGEFFADIPGEIIRLQQGNKCFLGIQPTQKSGSLQIYGDILFKAQFVAFNGADFSIGMAPQK